MSDEDGSFLQPRVLVPFAIITLIWGSTWIVIKDQLGEVPPTWSVTYRYIIATAAMFVYAALLRAPLRLDRQGHLLALTFGIPQFFLNFNFVYAAEQYITSGVVAVVFALLLVPNSAFAWMFLRHRVGGGFIAGSAIALAGVGLLFVHELRAATGSASAVALGIGLTLLGVLSASVANVLQATRRLRAYPIVSTLSWGMLYGTLANGLAAILFYGPPVVEWRLGYWAGLFYLGLFASALAFTFYFDIIRRIGPGRAAYSSLIVPVIAMTFSTLFEQYRWSLLAAAGAGLAMIGLAIALRARRPVAVPLRPDEPPSTP